MNEIVTIGANEKTRLHVRKHWFIFLIDSLRTILLFFVPFILFAVVQGMGQVSALTGHPLPYALLTFVALWWTLIIVCALAVLWTDYYLDQWIVTDERIVNINQRGLFDRETTTWRLERVQEVTIGVQNIFETMFGFGKVEVQTAGPSDQYAIIRGVRNPENIQRTIMQEVDRLAKNKGQGTVTGI